jgi:hypothetical protein
LGNCTPNEFCGVFTNSDLKKETLVSIHSLNEYAVYKVAVSLLTDCLSNQRSVN